MGTIGEDSFSDITYQINDGVGRVTINRPEVLNAFTPHTLEELIAVFREARDDPDVGVLVVTGAGDRAFSAGGDMNFESSHDDAHYRYLTLLKELYRWFRDCLKPVIARINGLAVGGGHHMAYMCDFSIAADHAILGQNGPRVASPAEGWLVAYLAEIVGPKRAKEMWMLCRRYTAQQALEWGLVNSVVPGADLDAEVDRWSGELLAMSPTALKTIKRSIDDAFAVVRRYEDSPPAGPETQFVGTLSRAPYLEAINAGFFASGEQEEGALAFLTKRAPDYSPWR